MVPLTQARRIVVKVGSALLVDAEPTFTTTRRAWVRGTMNENYTHPTCVAQPDDSPYT